MAEVFVHVSFFSNVNRSPPFLGCLIVIVLYFKKNVKNIKGTFKNKLSFGNKKYMKPGKAVGSGFKLQNVCPKALAALSSLNVK